MSAAALASDAGTPEGCICGEINLRHCPVHQDAGTPDAELDGLILAHASTVHQHPQDSFALGKTHQAIRAHVEKVKREARAAGERAATGEVVGQARIVGGKLGVDLIAERVPALLNGEIMQVDLVERRDKEGV